MSESIPPGNPNEKRGSVRLIPIGLQLLGEVATDTAGAAAIMIHLSETNPNIILLPAGLILLGTGITVRVFKILKWVQSHHE